MGESSNSKEEIKVENCPEEKVETTNDDLQNHPTKNIIIDIKTECDMNGEKNDAPVIDLAISL